MSLLSLLCVGVVFEEGSPSVTQAGPELEIPTLNLQEAGFRGVFLWVLCGFLLCLSLFCRDCSSGRPQTSCVRDSRSAPDPGPPPLRGWEDRHGSLGWTWGPLSGALFPGLEKGNKTVHAAVVSVSGQALYTEPDVPNGIQLLSHPRRWRLGSAPIYRAVGGGDPGGRNI